MVNSFNPEDAGSIKEAQQLLKKDSLGADLSYIASNLGFLAGAITQLEEAGLPLTHSLAILDNAKERLAVLPGAKGKVLKEKFEKVLKKNPSLETLHTVAKILEGKDSSLPDRMGPADVAELKYCPVTSVDVERSFSMFKNVFSDRRHNFKEENLSKVMVTNSFYAHKE